MLVPHSSAKKTYSSGPSLASELSSTECRVMLSAFFFFFNALLSVAKRLDALFVDGLDVSHMEMHSSSSC